MNDPEQKIIDLDLQLPPAPKPMGVYTPFLISGNQIFVSGHGPLQADGTFTTGKVNQDLTLEEAKAAARQSGLAILSTLKANLGNLNKIHRVVKVLGMVNCGPDFDKHPYVINGCSELFAQVFGPDKGIGVRSAVGMGSLPDNIPVEIEAIFELKS